MRTVPLRDCRNSLPVGLLLTKDGGSGDSKPLVHRDFSLRPVTGRTRIALAAPALQDNIAKQVTEMLTLTLEHVGTIKAPPRDVVRSLTFIDREYLNWIYVLGRIDTKTLDMQEVCGSCETLMDLSIDLDDLPVNILEDDDWDMRVVDGTAYMTFTFTSTKYGDLVLRMLTGDDHERVEPVRLKNPQEADARDVHACVVTLGDKPVTYDQFLDQDEDVIAWMQACSKSIDIGAAQEVDVVCESCTETTRVGISPLALYESWRTPEVVPPYAKNCSSSG